MNLDKWNTTSAKVCGLLSVLSGTWRGPDSTDRPNRPLTGSCQEPECECASWGLLAVLLGPEQAPGRSLSGLSGGSRSSRVLARAQFADVVDMMEPVKL